MILGATAGADKLSVGKIVVSPENRPTRCHVINLAYEVAALSEIEAARSYFARSHERQLEGFVV
jgi:hypothetical protein